MIYHTIYCPTIPYIWIQVAIPVYVRHSLSWVGGTNGRLDITVGPKQTMGRTVEQVIYMMMEYIMQ